MHPPTHLHNDSTTHVLREHIELTLLTEMKRLYAAGTIDMPRMRAIARRKCISRDVVCDQDIIK